MEEGAHASERTRRHTQQEDVLDGQLNTSRMSSQSVRARLAAMGRRCRSAARLVASVIAVRAQS